VEAWRQPSSLLIFSPSRYAHIVAEIVMR
jgi:hypothetical protein